MKKLLLLSLLTAVVSCQKSQNDELIFKYGDATILMPEEIDCASVDDTLFILSATENANGKRVIKLGYRFDAETQKRRDAYFK